MRSSLVIHVVSCHAAGEVGDVVVGGVGPVPGPTVWEQSRWIAADGRLRNFLLNEPRGGVFRHVNLLVPALTPGADIGFIIMEPVHTPPMSGSNAMCVATVVLETGILPMSEPVTRLVLEAPGGLVAVEASCSGGKVTSVELTNVASFAHRLDAPLEVAGVGTVRVDTAFGGDSFVLVDGADLGFAVTPDEAADLARLGATITRAANEQLGFEHPGDLGWHHLSFCQIAGPLQSFGPAAHQPVPSAQPGGANSGIGPGPGPDTGSRPGPDTGSRPGAGGGRHWEMRSTTVIDPGKLDRSPTGTGVSARMAVLAARGQMAVGDRLTMRSIIGSVFVGSVRAAIEVGGRPAIVPTVAGQAWITGTHQHLLDPTDPWPQGYRLADTWPGG